MPEQSLTIDFPHLSKEPSAPPMDVFVDTNILLSLYRLSGPDLDELKKLVGLGKARRLTVHINDQVRDEFLRNREKTISSSLDEFMKGRNRQPIPNLIESYPDTVKLREALDLASRLVHDLNQAALTDACNNSLKADEVVGALFKEFPPSSVAPANIERARLRHERGNPPGASSTIGDEINWEWLLENVPRGQTLHIISADGDYESELHKKSPKQLLSDEWKTARSANLRLYKSLPEFLKEHFPDIKLSNEIEKTVVIDRLVHSRSFEATHKAISDLDWYDDFSDSDLKKLFAAYCINDQVKWIVDDEDVITFAEKLLKLGVSRGMADEVLDMQLLLDATRARKARQKARHAPHESSGNDDIPF